MTRRLRPPVSIDVQCRPDGRPARLRRGGRERTVTHVAACWIRPAPWWAEATAEAGNPSLHGERTYYRIVAGGAARGRGPRAQAGTHPVVYEIFQTATGDWFLERIVD
jgi:hypothetical protein